MLTKKTIIILSVVIGLTSTGIFITQNTHFLDKGRLKSASDDLGGIEQKESYQAYDMATPMSPAVQRGRVNAETPIQRKVITNIELNLQVKDVTRAQARINDLVARMDGIIISSSLNSALDGAKNGTSSFKVLPIHLNQTLIEIKSMGDIKLENQTGEDVTEQYVDLQGRLKNYKIVRDRLEKIMTERARQVKDILEIETELTRVGGEIESLEGRIKYLDQESAMATVTVNFYESNPHVVKGLDFGESLKKTMRSSIEIFFNVFQAAIMIVALVIPVCIWVGVIYVIFLAVKKIFYRRK